MSTAADDTMGATQTGVRGWDAIYGDLPDDWLDRQLYARGINQIQLARSAGVSEPVITRLRHGRRVSAVSFGRIYRALRDVPVVAPDVLPKAG